MRTTKFLGSAIVAGAAGLMLLDSAAAQVKLPAADEIPKNVPSDRQVDSNTQIESTVTPKSQIEPRIESKPREVDAANPLDEEKIDAQANIRNETQTHLGFELGDDSEEVPVISAVQENSIAARAGLRTGDRIVSVDGREIHSHAKLNEYLSTHGRGQVVLMFDRDGRRYQTSFMHPGHLALRGQIDGQNGRLMGTTFATGERGIVVSDIPEGSPLQHAGFHPGDEIVCFNGWSYRDVDQFVSTMNRMPKGQPIAVNVIRDGRWMSTRITLPREDETYLDGSAHAEVRGQLRQDGRVPPVPQTYETEKAARGDKFARAETQGRRTALKPNFDQSSQEQLQQQIDKLRDENQKLRQELKKYRDESRLNGPQPGSIERPDARNDDPDADVDAKINSESNGAVDVNAERKVETKTDGQPESDSSRTSREVEKPDTREQR